MSKIGTEWHKSDGRGMAIIDAEIEYDHFMSPAKHEIVRQVIYATGDFDYKDLIYFSDQALELGAAAIAARTSIVVDVNTLQAAISPILQSTFANGSYACTTVVTRPQNQKSQAVWGMETLAQRYPRGIFIIGESQSALETLVSLIKAKEIIPAMVIAAPAEFVNVGAAKFSLQQSMVPSIFINSQKGGVIVAAKIFSALVALAWEIYGAKN